MYHLDCIGWFDLERDGLSCESFDEDLHGESERAREKQTREGSQATDTHIESESHLSQSNPSHAKPIADKAAKQVRAAVALLLYTSRHDEEQAVVQEGERKRSTRWMVLSLMMP